MEHKQKVAILKALADDVRLSIVRKLASESSPVASCTLVESCSELLKLSQPTMSHHVHRLVDSGVLIEQKQGTQKLYQLNRQLLRELGLDSKKI